MDLSRPGSAPLNEEPTAGDGNGQALVTDDAQGLMRGPLSNPVPLGQGVNARQRRLRRNLTGLDHVAQDRRQLLVGGNFAEMINAHTASISNRRSP
jgi:hypothetical protein